MPATLLGKSSPQTERPCYFSLVPFASDDASELTLTDNIHRKRRATLSALEKDAYKSVTAIHSKVESLNPCNGAMEKLATYTLQLCQVKDGAYELAATKMSLADVWDGLEQAAEEMPESTKKCSKGCEGGCTVDVREVLAQAVEESKEGVEGLCLRCVRDGEKGLRMDKDEAWTCEHEE